MNTMKRHGESMPGDPFDRFSLSFDKSIVVRAFNVANEKEADADDAVAGMNGTRQRRCMLS